MLCMSYILAIFIIWYEISQSNIQKEEEKQILQDSYLIFQSEEDL